MKETMKTKQQTEQQWLAFKQRTSQAEFWACIDAEGYWFDSAHLYTTAVRWCRIYHGEWGEPAMVDVDWMDTFGHQAGYSIVHHTMLRKLWEQGLVK